MSAVGVSHSGTGSLSLMSCVRESSPPQDLGPEHETEKSSKYRNRYFSKKLLTIIKLHA